MIFAPGADGSGVCLIEIAVIRRLRELGNRGEISFCAGTEAYRVTAYEGTRKGKYMFGAYCSCGIIYALTAFFVGAT